MPVRKLVAHPRAPMFCPYDQRKIASVEEGQDNWLRYLPCGHWEPALIRAERITREATQRLIALDAQIKEERNARARTRKTG